MKTNFSVSIVFRIVLVFAAATLLLLVTLSGQSALATRRQGFDAAPVAGDASTRRVAAANLVVTSTADSGYGTLRWAMQNASSPATITFALANPATITLLSALPDITQGNLTITSTGVMVILEGSGLSAGNGFHITSNGNTIKGLRILHFPWNGVLIDGGASNNLIGGINATPDGTCTGDCNVISGNKGRGIGIGGPDTNNNVVSGNYIGTDASGTVAMGNGGVGIQIYTGARENQIGGSDAGKRNLISGNDASGIQLNDSTTVSNTVIGNYIGTNVGGAAALMNHGQGVQVSGAQRNRIGGSLAGERNIISGNGGNGVMLCDSSTQDNTVVGNYIGTDAGGSFAIANGGQGVLICVGAHGNRIGGILAGERNVISGNHSDGIKLNDSGTMSNTITGNTIGTNVSGTASLPNTDRGIFIDGGASQNIIGVSNTIAFNGSHGVEIKGNGTISNTITRNSIFLNKGDGITLTKGLPAPRLTYANLSEGVAAGTACANCTVEIFSDDDGEGRIFEGQVTASNAGRFFFDRPGSFSGPHLTATATDGSPGLGDTSAFSTAPFTCSVPDMAALGRYHFEYGDTQGWFAQYGESKSGINIVVTATTETAWTGHHALRAAANAANVQDWWMAAAGLDSPAPGMSPTGTVTAHLYIPVTSTISWANLYILDNGWTWFNSPDVPLQPGQWITLAWTLNPTVTYPLRRFGVQFGGNFTGPLDDALYLDAIDWSHPVYTHPIYTGAYLSGTGTISFTDELNWLDNVGGKHAGLVNIFVGWKDQFPANTVDTILAHRSAPLITWEPWVVLTDVVKGVHDAYIDEWAIAISQTYTTVFLRWGHEMNGNWYPWGGNPEAYKAAWRYIHDRMVITDGVKNIAWVWTPNNQSAPDESWNAYYNYYPGDTYVDWVGASGYNAANKATWDPKPPCRTFDDIFSAILDDMADRYQKPQMIPEFASACDNGCDKMLWITEAYYQALFHRRLRALVWFNVAKWEGEGVERKWVDWRINCSGNCACYEAAYAQALADQRYSACPVAPLMTIHGPTTGMVHASYTFTASISPLAETPTVYTWQAAGQSPVTNTGGMSNTAFFTWRMPGPGAITVTAANSCNTVSSFYTVTIAGKLVYLPIVFRND